jgi:hypothetical protein
MGVGRYAPKPGTVTKSVSGSNPGGRPKKVQPSILPLSTSGQIKPEVMNMANEFIKTHTMPPGLQSRWHRNRTNQHISQGFAKPKALGNG